jgi:CheY-like chemotaxis protein
MNKQLRILVLEDMADDVLMIERELRKGGLVFHCKRVDTRQDFVRELHERTPDLVFSDHGLPSFDGLAALAVARQQCPEVPFIFVTGSPLEETAAETFEDGATDYVPKDRLSELVPAVRRALQLTDERARRQVAERALRESEEKCRRLSALRADTRFVRRENRTLSASAAEARVLDLFRRCLNMKFKEAGRMTALCVDSRNKTLTLRLLLKGETASIQVKVHGYTLREEKGAAFLELGKVRTTRDWINVLLRQRSPVRRLEVTGWEKVLRVLL